MVFASRMSTLAESLSKRLMDGGSMERRDLSSQLLQLSKLIDHSVASNQKPNSQQRILKSFKEFAAFKFDEMLRPSIMVLMLSIKSACLAGWFSESDAQELLRTYRFLFNYFQLDGECLKPPPLPGGTKSNEVADSEAFISMICARYLPRYMLISVIVALTAKPGYEVRGCDFQVTSQLAPYTKLRLFVCQTDNVGTSACLVAPPHLSFLLNGKGVERRMYLTNVTEAGPQLPSDITTMLRIGCNFLQIIGDCTASYFVAVGIMGSMPWSSSSIQLEEYVTPSSSLETDDELVVGRSRVSLRCPISHKLIKTPVKGVLCRHQQAFDYDSYMEINDRRPSWRCPCCNTHVNCTELRHDRQMAQVLREADENLIDVMVNHDGSWAPVSSGNINNAHMQSIGKSSGDTAVGSLEEGIINISDDDEDECGAKEGGTVVAQREPSLAKVSTHANPIIDLVHAEDRKPDIRSMYVGQAVVGSESMQAPVPVAVSNRSTLENPVVSARYSPISLAPDQAAFNTGAIARTVQDSHGGSRSMGQSPSSWAPVNGYQYASPVPTGGHLSDNRLPSAERQHYSQPMRTSVIQALPANTYYTNLNDRGRVSLSGHVSGNPVAQAMPGVPSAGQSASLLPTSLALDVQSLQQQVHNSDMGDMLLMQELRQQAYNLNAQRLLQQREAALRNQGQGQRASMLQGVAQNGQGQRASMQQGVTQNGHGNVRISRTQHFAGTSSHQLGQGHQSSNHLGQQFQYPISTPHQSVPMSSNHQGQQFQYPINAPQQSIPISRSVQDQRHRQRISQHLQQAVLASSHQRSPAGGGVSGFSLSSAPGALSGGRGPAGGGISGVPLPSAPGALSGGSRHVLGSRMGSHTVYPLGTNSAANTPVVTSHSSSAVEGWIPPPQITNWRQPGAPRMRGAVVTPPTTGMSGGVRGGGLPGMAQPGPVNRMRAPQNIINMVPATMSQLMSTPATTAPQNIINMVPATMSQLTSTPATTVWGGRISPAVGGSGPGEPFSAEPLPTTSLLQENFWPTTPLDSSQINIMGSHDTGNWIDDALFMSTSPPGQ